MCINAISELRKIIADNLEENSVHYRDFLAQPIAFNDPYNADMEAPNDYDAFIVNPEQLVELRWAHYIDRLQNGAWGDHLTVQGMSNCLILQSM